MLRKSRASDFLIVMLPTDLDDEILLLRLCVNKQLFKPYSVLTLSGFNAKVGFNVKTINKTWFYHTKLLC